LKAKKHMIIHAPTGLGKTASTIPMALSHALKNDLTVFFLTSRHTQHTIAVDTLKAVKKKHDVGFLATDIIGKKWMCIVPGIEALHSNEFSEYCKKEREEGKCEFYVNTKKKSGMPTVMGQMVLSQLKNLSPSHTEEIIEISRSAKLCPYEMSGLLGRESNVIIADYNYIFNQPIRDAFFLKTDKKLLKAIIIVDEAHNLPKRIRELLTIKLNNFILDRAIKEAKKFKLNETVYRLKVMNDILNELAIDLT